jgi:two-component system response regulator
LNDEKTILLVEDDPDDELLTCRALAGSNIANRVIVARDGAEALELLFGSESAGKGPMANLPEVVLLDLKLPKVSGLEVLQRIRAEPRTRALPVVVLTSSGENRDVRDCYALGANSYVQKPVEFEQFVDAAKQLGLYWLVLNRPPLDLSK